MKSFELVLFEFPREAPFGIGFGLDISHCWVMFRSVQVYLTQCPAGYVNFGSDKQRMWLCVVKVWSGIISQIMAGIVTSYLGRLVQVQVDKLIFKGVVRQITNISNVGKVC